MKIFGWVHRRFHKKNVVDEDANIGENDKLSLLENDSLEGACDGWKEGILTIGTLGIDLSNNQLLSFGHEDDEEDNKGEMESSLVLGASKHGFHQLQKQDPSPCDQVDHNDIEEVDAKGAKDLDIECILEKKTMKSGERTTLADLLWGDSEKNLLKDKLSFDHVNVPNHVSPTTEFVKSSLISKKKKIEKDDSTHPIKKTKRLMRKMLKKKIHPDIASQKKEIAGIISEEILVHAT